MNDLVSSRMEAKGKVVSSISQPLVGFGMAVIIIISALFFLILKLKK